MTMKEYLVKYLYDRRGTGYPAKALAAATGRPEPSVRRDLVELYRADVIHRRKDGQKLFYYCKPDACATTIIADGPYRSREGN